MTWSPADSASLAAIAAEATDELINKQALRAQTLIQTGLQLAQLVLYYDALDDAIDKRDLAIQAQIDWMQELEDLKDSQDLPMLNLKASVLTALSLPGVNLCGDALLQTSKALKDGQAVVEKSEHLAAQSCRGVPNGWGLHDGALKSSLSASHSGALLGNSGKRRVERFRKSKTQLVRAAQQGMKAVYNANDTLARYAQAAAIHTGFADIYIQGFNSAGAGLGVGLGRLSTLSGDQTGTQSTSAEGAVTEGG